MNRRRLKTCVLVPILTWGVLPHVGHAGVEVLPDAAMTVDGASIIGQAAIVRHATMQDIVAAFRRADLSVQRHDLDPLMSFYAQSYNYHGLKRTDVRRIWSEVFAHYRSLSSTHLFSEVRVLRSDSRLRAEITCTGALYGTEAQSGARITLDSWFREVHHLVYEDGTWRFSGNAGAEPHAAPFTAAPHHPLF